ncbi:hypothetical protein RYX36_016539 [Vicia faba]
MQAQIYENKKLCSSFLMHAYGFGVRACTYVQVLNRVAQLLNQNVMTAVQNDAGADLSHTTNIQNTAGADLSHTTNIQNTAGAEPSQTAAKPDC